MDNKNLGEMRNLKSKKLYLQVYDEICSYIKENNLDFGDKLPTEAEMTQMLGVSRNVLREAIKALEITGVITSKPGVGITICKPRAEFSLSSLLSQINSMNEDIMKHDIKEVRKILELSFCRQAFDTITPKKIEILEAQLEIMEAYQRVNIENLDKKLCVQLSKADAQFHSTLFSNTDNLIFLSILELFWASDLYLQINNSSSVDALNITINKHQRILSALKKNNYKAFYDAMVYHFTYKYI